MNIESYFPVVTKMTYLNTAFCGLLSKNVLEIKQRDAETLYNTPYLYLDDEHKIIEETKQIIANIFNVEQENVAITQNFSLGFNLILDGIDKNKKFLLLENDYPSVLLPIKKRNFQYTSLEISHDIEHRIYNFINKNRPEVLALSITQFLDGLHIKPSFLSQLKQDFPELLILADATQYLGTEAFDFEASKVDFLSASCYKWLNAGFGSAIVMLSEQFKQQLNTNVTGANSFIDKTKMNLKPMGFLESGHYDLNSIKSLNTALNLHYYTIGIQYISNRIRLLSKYAFQEFKDLNLLDPKIVDRQFHFNIFNLKIEQNYADTFKDQHIYISKRGNGLRVSLHYYNTQEDIDRFIDVYKNILPII